MQSNVNISNEATARNGNEETGKVRESRNHEEIRKIIDRYKQTIMRNENIDKDLIMFVETRATAGQIDRENDESFELALHIHKNLLNSDSPTKAAFIVGEAGSGKTLFCKFLQRAMLLDWEIQEDDKGRWFPIYIDSSSLETFNMKEIVSKTLSSELKLTQKEIDMLQNACTKGQIKLLLIFDGLERDQRARQGSTNKISHRNILLAVTLLQKHWKNSKCIVTSREKIPSLITEEECLLEDTNKATGRPVIEYNLQGFSDLEITAYLRKHAVLQGIYNLEELVKIFCDIPLAEPSWSLVKDDEDIIECFDLRELLRLPLLLRIASDVLPDLIDYEKQISIWDVYESFINKQVQATVQKYLANQDSKPLPREDRDEVSLIKLIKQELEKSAVILSKYTLSAQKEERKEDNKVLNELLHLCPILRWDQSRVIGCIHKSIDEFLIAKKIEKALIQASNKERIVDDSFFLLNQRFLSSNSIIIKYLSDSVRNGQMPSKNLLMIIEESKAIGKVYANQRRLGLKEGLDRYRTEMSQSNEEKSPTLEQKNHILYTLSSSGNLAECFSAAAANAMMILNASGFKFTGLDLSYVCIPYADLTSGTFEKTNFSYADLDGVNFTGANLKDAILTGANLRNVEFGGFTNLEIDSEISCVAFSPNSKYIAVGVDEGIAVYARDSKENHIFKEVTVLKQKTDDVQNCVFSPDLKCLVSNGSDDVVRLWDIEKGLLIKELGVNKGSLKYCAFSPNGTQLLTATINQNCFWLGVVDSVIQIWNPVSGDCKHVIHENANTAVLEFSPDGRQLLLPSSNGAIQAINPTTYSGLNKYRGDFTCILSLCKYSSDGRNLAISMNSSSILMWDTVRSYLVKSLNDNSKHNGGLNSFSFDLSDNNLFLFANNEVITQNVATGEQILLFHSSSDSPKFTISSDRKLLTVQSKKSSISIYEINYDNTTKSYIIDADNKKMDLKGTNVDSAFELSEKNATVFRQLGEYSQISKAIMEKLILNSSNLIPLRLINLNSHGINDAGGAIIGRNLAWVNLEELELKSNQLGDRAGQAIGHNKEWTNLRKLNLSENRIGNEGATSIGSNTTWKDLEELYLSKNLIQEKGVIAIGTNDSWENLRILDLKGNKIGYQDALSISKNTTWTQLCTLDLGSNAIRTAGAVEISKNTSWIDLSNLDLSWNKIGALGAANLLNNTAWKKMEIINLSCNAAGGHDNFDLSQDEWENLKILNLQRNSLNDLNLTNLSKMAGWKNLKILNLAENQFSASGIKELSQSSNLRSLESLNLAYASISDEGTSELTKNLSWTKLQTLNLGWNNIGAFGAAELSRNTSWDNLKTLILSGNIIGASGTAALCKNSTWKAFESLHLENNSIGDEGAITLGKSETFSNLKLLILADNCIGDAGCLGLSKNKFWTSLQVINLAENFIGPKGTIELKSNKTWTNIQTINLEGNSIGPAGASNLIKNGSWINIQVINLESNSIGALGAAELSRASMWESVVVLNLGSNSIGNSGATALSRNETWINLQVLNLHYNSISEEGAESLSKNTSWNSLITLNLERNSIDDRGAQWLSKNSSWKNLQTLNLHNNLIVQKGSKYLRSNPHWVKLKNVYI